jgi:hypothetical protein
MQKDQCQHQETKDSFSGRKAVPGGALPHGEPFSADNFKTQKPYDYSNSDPGNAPVFGRMERMGILSEVPEQ